MAIVAGTQQTFETIGNREDLTNAIYDISPTDTPFISSIARVSATSVKHEWQTDVLAAAVNTAAVEGDEAAADTAIPTVRLDNQCQIFRKVVIVSRTQRKVLSAGRRDEYSYQLAKRGKELKRNIEKAFLSRMGKTVGTCAGARYAGAALTYITVENGVHFASITVTFSGAGETVAEGNNAGGTIGKLKAALDTLIGVLWNEGSDANVIMCGRTYKENISTMSGIATLYREVPKGYQGAIIGGADLYVSNFGEFVVVPNRFIGANQILILDYDYWSVAELDPIEVAPLAKTGDADKAMIICEATLECRSPAANAAILNYTLSA